MNVSDYPYTIEKYVLELIRRRTLSSDAFMDKMLMNYLCTLKIDEDYIKNSTYFRCSKECCY